MPTCFFCFRGTFLKIHTSIRQQCRMAWAFLRQAKAKVHMHSSSQSNLNFRIRHFCASNFHPSIDGDEPSTNVTRLIRARAAAVPRFWVSSQAPDQACALAAYPSQQHLDPERQDAFGQISTQNQGRHLNNLRLSAHQTLTHYVNKYATNDNTDKWKNLKQRGGSNVSSLYHLCIVSKIW